MLTEAKCRVCGVKFMCSNRRKNKDLCNICVKIDVANKLRDAKPKIDNTRTCACGNTFTWCSDRRHKDLCKACSIKAGALKRTKHPPKVDESVGTPDQIKEIEMKGVIWDSQIAINNLSIALRDLLVKTLELGDMVGRRYKSSIERNAERVLYEYGPDWAREAE